MSDVIRVGLWRIVPLLCLLTLAACGGAAMSGGGSSFAPAGGIECVPFARAITGVRLAGDAHSWWDSAEGRYERAQAPTIGGILVFRRTSRLPHGHVSVVSQVLSDRRILVTQANWVHGRVTLDQPVIDISPDNDWTMVRVWWDPARSLGVTPYPTYGFVLPDQPMTHDAVNARAPRAAQVASGYASAE